MFLGSAGIAQEVLYGLQEGRSVDRQERVRERVRREVMTCTEGASARASRKLLVSRLSLTE